jgi:hypothetical protein
MLQPTRRRILISIPALALAACTRGKDSGVGADSGSSPTPEREPEPEPWSPDGTVDEDAFPYGIQIGDATAEGALLSVHTSEPTVTLVVAVVSGEGWRADPHFRLLRQ